MSKTRKKKPSEEIVSSDGIPLEVGKELLLKKCETREEFRQWIHYFLDLELPHVTVSRYADTNPLDAMWEVYKICVLRENPEKIQELLYVASRGAGKCVSVGTEIKLLNGPKKIEDVKVGDVVWTGWDWQPVVQTFDEGPKQAVRITTSAGRQLTGSYKHRIQAIDPATGKMQWRFLTDLKVGELIYHQDETAKEYSSPAITGLLTDIRDELGYDSDSINELLTKHQVFNRRQVEFWRDLAYRHGLKQASSDAMFLLDGGIDQIIEVEHLVDYMFDLEVNYTHAYLSNGIVSHNTLGMAISEFMVMLHDQRDVVHVGVALAQAKRAYEYLTKFLLSPKIRPFVDPPGVDASTKILQRSTMEKTVFNINNEQVSIEVLPATLKALNGPHASFVAMDELDTASGESLRALKEATGMLDTKKGRRPLRIGISTRKSRAGLMHKQIENADKEGRTVRRWTALEFTERCPDERSGTEKIELYTNIDTLEVMTEKEFDAVEPQRKKDFEKNEFFDKCRVCPIAPYCKTDLKKQVAKGSMLKSIDELIQKVKGEGAEWASAQLMNLTPSLEGIVYREFEEKKHLKTWNELWEILTGRPFPGECSHDLFVKKCLEMRLTCFGGVDWGWSNPNTVTYVFVDNKDNVYVVRCDGMTMISQPGWIHHIKTKYHRAYRCQMYFPDIADQGAVDEMKKAGLPVSTNVDKTLNTGIQTIKKFLRVPGQPQPKIFIAKDTCKPLIEEFQTYSYKVDAAGDPTDLPQEGNDHWLDGLRYILGTLYGGSTVVMANGQDEDFVDSSPVDSTGAFLKTPTPEEFAKAQGIQVNTEIDTSKIGKIENSKFVNDEDDDEGVGGGGGFLWSF